MKTTKLLSFLLIFGFALAPLNHSVADTKYVGKLSGVECTACKKTISRSLAKLKGVKTIRIIKQKDGNHRLELITDGSQSVSLADARKALKKADHYKVLSWEQK